MNQREWKNLIQKKKGERPDNLFYYRNLAAKILGYKKGMGLVIHHLRETEEQCHFNDANYERWGIDFDNQLKYTVLITIEEHRKIHALSLETKNKISKSVSISKTKFTKEEIKEHKRISNKKYRNTHKKEIQEKQKTYYIKNSEKIKAKVKGYRESNKEKIKQQKKDWKEKNREYVNQKKREYYAKRKKNM